MADWYDFVTCADEWLVGYSVPPSLLVKPFMIGHTVELYLKATYTKLSGDADAAIRYGHRIKELWNACKALDPNFMPEYEFRDSVFSVNLLETNMPDSSKPWNERLNQEDHKHFMENQAFYFVAWLLPDLKYMMAPPKKNAFRFAFWWPDNYWVAFLKSLRNYLGLPLSDRIDMITANIKDGGLPLQSIQYLKLLYA